MPKAKTTKRKTKSRFESLIGNQNGPGMPFKCPTIDQNGLGNTNVAKRKNKRSWAKIEAKFEVSEGNITLDLPIRTVSEANCFEPWQKKHGRHKDQKRAVAFALNPVKGNIRLPCQVMLTRFAPDFLDEFDNLPMSFKYIVDAVCAIITGNYVAGRADSDKRINIRCGQIKSSAYGIRIQITW